MKFKTLVTFSALLVCSNVSYADTAMCKNIAFMAETAMTARQGGVSLIDTMEALDNLEDPTMPVGVLNSTKKLMKEITIAAYERPRYDTEIMKKNSINDFKDLYYLECIKTIK